jgi:hypothetical protein
MSTATINDPLPARFADLKREIASLYPDFEKNVTRAWAEVLDQLKVAKKKIIEGGSDVSYITTDPIVFDLAIFPVYSASQFCRPGQT